MKPIILASGSASRRAILSGAGVPFTVQRPDVDEDALKEGFTHLDPQALALSLARAKALSVKAEDSLVIGADQVMAFRGRAYDKPKNKAELQQRLADMAGEPHHLCGGVVIARDGEVIAEIEDSATLVMRELTGREIALYTEAIDDAIATGTVGGYALEGQGARLFSSVSGDFFSILGLPLFPVLAVLRQEGGIPW